MKNGYPEGFFDTREIYWLCATRDEILASGAESYGLCEDLNEFGLSQAWLTQEEAEFFIPKNTFYCYDRGPDGEFRCCPFWDKISQFPSQSNGHCHYLKSGDYSDKGMGLLWDQCKSCGKFEDLLDYDDETT